LDNTFLMLEGTAQWIGYAWLVHPKGGNADPSQAILAMRRGKWWSQEEGLALFLVLNRLLPGWPKIAFGDQPIGAIDLLEMALHTPRVIAVTE